MATTDLDMGISFCMPGSPITTLPACNYFHEISNHCPTLADKEWKKCVCNQDVFDSLYECESEVRLCFLNNKQDSDWEHARWLWHSMCDSLTVAVTTPPLSSLTSTNSNPEFCQSQVIPACKSARMAFRECNAQESIDLSSCVCDPTMILNLYTCDYLGNKSCHLLPGGPPLTADTTNLAAWSECDNFEQVITAADVEPTTIIPPISKTPPGPPSVPFSPTAPTATPTTTTSSNSAAAVLAIQTTKLLFLLCGFCVWWL